MEKGFRTAICFGCEKKIEFRITEKHYGLTVVIVCKGCGTKGRVTIPRPAPELTPAPAAARKSASQNIGNIFGGLDDFLGDHDPFKGKKK